MAFRRALDPPRRAPFAAPGARTLPPTRPLGRHAGVRDAGLRKSRSGFEPCEWRRGAAGEAVGLKGTAAHVIAAVTTSRINLSPFTKDCRVVVAFNATSTDFLGRFGAN